MWRKSEENSYGGCDGKSCHAKWKPNAVDRIIGSNSQFCAIAEIYASDDAMQRLVVDFVAAWTKVMYLDLFDPGPAMRT